MSLATLKTKVQALIDDLKTYKSFNSQMYSFSLYKTYTYYAIPKSITNWNKMLVNLTNDAVTVESNADIKSMETTFQNTKNNCVLTLNINTKNVNSFMGCFYVPRKGGVKEILGTPLDFSNATTLSESFLNCINLTELRVKENTIPYNVWDLSFTESDNLSEETLLSIAKGVIKAPDSVPDADTAFISFSSNVLDNMPEYIKQIFNEKRCELG